MGTCLPHHGQRDGSPCQRNSDCDVGLVCAVSEAGKTCQQPSAAKKQYSKSFPALLPTYIELIASV